ncbi:vitellogenin-2-like [Genypterus blacodes]|uniref:vitellogenin-2-like n=1 Tax=Genypterus blacodes TaxID=154954 RepID=UPI003F771B40
MKVFVLLALTFALAAGQHVAIAPLFAAGKTYVYKYEAVLLGGLPEEGLARAGLKIQSKILISAATADTLILKLDQPELFEYSGIWPKDAFIPATKLKQALAAQLSTPIKFEYTNGVVTKLYALPGVSATVLNIFRGILNIFQLNIKKTQNVYELQEPGVQGVCKTHYLISEDAKAERIHLSKTKDLNQCQERIMKDIGLAYTEKCPECVAKGEALKGAAAFAYIIKSTASGTVILQATATELIQFAPFSILNGAAQMEAKQTLALVEVLNTPVPPIREQYVVRGSLQYEFGAELLQTPIQLLRVTNPRAQIIEVLNHVVTFNVAKVHDDAPLKFVELVQLLRVATFETIEGLWAEIKNRPEHRHWLLSAVPAIGTHSALRLIKEKFIIDELTIAETAKALVASVHMVTADLEAIKLVEALAFNHKVQANRVLHEIVMLGYGTMIAKYCAESPTCSPELLRPIHELVMRAVTTKDIGTLAVALKVLGNAGHPSSLKTIMKLLPGFSSAAAALPHKIHVDAVLALRNIAKKEPKMIQDIALQLFMEKAAQPELRMVAAVVLFETKLPMGLVITLANAVKKEQNLQIASLVFTYMKAMTKNTAPDLAPVAAACNVAVKILSPKFARLSTRYSRALYYDIYHSPWMVGAAASAFYINDAATLLPKAIVAKARTYLAGAYADVLELGVRAEGIQEAFEKANHVVENADRLTKMKQVMKAIAEWRAHPAKLPLASVYVKFFGQEIAFANIDKVIVDQIIELATGPAVRTHGRMALDALLSGISMHYAQPLLVAEVRRILPTAVGLPMELALYTSAVAAANVKLHAAVTPALPANFPIAQLLKSDISLRAEIIPSIALNTYAVMGVNTILAQAALMTRAEVQTIAPAKMDVRLDMIKNNFKLELLPVPATDKIASAVVETFAIARNVEDLAAAKITPLLPAKSAVTQEESLISKLTSTMESSLESDRSWSSEMIHAELQSLTKQKVPRQFRKKMCSAIETFGIKACTVVESLNVAAIKEIPLYAVIGKHAALIEVSPVAGPVIEKIEIEVQFGERAAEKIVKVINNSEEEETIEEKNVLLKLKKILAPGLKNLTASSSSSSSSRSSSSKSSSSASSSSSSRSSSQQKSRTVAGRSPVSKGTVSSSSSSRSLSQSSSRSSSSSSSISRASRQNSREKIYKMKFFKDHIHQHQTSTARPTSRSSASSFEAIYKKEKYLASAIIPVVTILIRAVRADRKAQGYQVAAYYDKVPRRVQLTFANLAETSKWTMCADGLVLSRNKLVTKLGWGVGCSEYQTLITGETGALGGTPSLRLKVTWGKLPRVIKRYVKKLPKYIERISGLTGLSLAKAKNVDKQFILILSAPSETSLNFVMKTPRLTIYKLDMGLPLHLPIGETASELEIFQDDWTGKINYMIRKAHAAECTLVENTLTTFNNRKYNHQLPDSCYQILAQDCTPELKFMVLMRKETLPEQNQIYVKIADIDVDMYQKDNAIMLKVNGMVVPIDNLAYQHPTEQIHITKRGEGIVLHAASLGLHEVYFDQSTCKIKVLDWMRGQTCGLCGKADGEIRQEFRTPNERISKHAVSFAHSWVLPAKSCRDTSECQMKMESVKLDRQVNIRGQESKCYSAEPVLRCLPGCLPLRTAPVKVGYHCVPADTNMNRYEGLNSMFDKSADITAEAEAHLACRCTAQCA